jgi:formate-dependent nitrite reductase membrane component NrfD
VRTGRYAAFVGTIASGVLLIKDLGRPERFFNMLRIVKLGSPMSVGVYSLGIFSGATGMAVLEQLQRDGIVPFNPGWFIPKKVRNGALAVGAGLLAGYTGVLISATAIPVWYRSRRFIPAIFVASALTTACAFNSAVLALTGAPAATLRKVEKLETIASACELGLLLAYERVVGAHAAAFFGGSTGRNVKVQTMLGGLTVPLALNLPVWFSKNPPAGERAHGAPLKTLASAALALYGGYVLRRSFIEAGRRSADDPKPVLERPAG